MSGLSARRATGRRTGNHQVPAASELRPNTRHRYSVDTHELSPMSDKPVTLINVFTVEPSGQQELVALLSRATEGSVRHAAGFVSARLHRSLDGTKVTMYAQWRSVEDCQAMRADLTPLPYLQQALAIAKFEPGIYEVVQTFFPAGGDA